MRSRQLFKSLILASLLSMPMLCGASLNQKEERMASFADVLKDNDAEADELKVREKSEDDDTRSENSKKNSLKNSSAASSFAKEAAKYSDGAIVDRVLVRGRDYSEKDLGISVRSKFKKKDSEKEKDSDKNNKKTASENSSKSNKSDYSDLSSKLKSKLFEDGDFEDGSAFKVFDDPIAEPSNSFIPLDLFDLPDSVTNPELYAGMEKVFLGRFKLTAYDACVQCCGKTDGITASGTHVTSGRTVAVDKNLIPLGSKLLIGGHVYTAEDTGSDIKGNWIDVYRDTHEIAKQFGVKYQDVYLLK